MNATSLANSILHYFFHQPAASSPTLSFAPARTDEGVNGLATFPAMQPSPLVLVAEGNATAARRIAAELKRMGIQARTVATGAQCLAEAPKCRPDMVLFDLDLIFAEGINSAALRQSAAQAGCPPIIFLEGAQDDKAVNRVRAYFERIQRHQQIAREIAEIAPTGAPEAERVVTFGNNGLDAAAPSSPAPTADLVKSNSDLAAVVRLASWVFEPVAANKGIKLHVDSPVAGLVATCDEVRIQRVLENLLSNAIKASPAGSAITLAARQEDGWLRFWVDDSGPGVPVREQSGLFDEPTNLVDLLEADDNGSSRGLVVCQHIVTSHGGEMAMHNRREGGAHFEFRLPVAANSSTRSAQPGLVTMKLSVAAVA